MKRFVYTLALLVLSALRVSADTVSTFTLDSVSYISFQDQEVLFIPAGSSITFHFGEPAVDGTMTFTISPTNVSIKPISMADGRELRYELVAPASGTLKPTPSGSMITFTAAVQASFPGEDGGAMTYSVPFTTENVIALNASKTEAIGVEGVRLVDGNGYAQIVGTAVNKPSAEPGEPGAAVYTVLSGRFDPIP